MSFTEKYIRAVSSSNLKDDEHHFATNPLIGIALSKVRMASALYRVRYCNDATSYHQLLEHLIDVLANKSISRKWPQHVSVKSVSKLALEYWINPICYFCKGRGFEVHLNKHGGVEMDCAACNSTGKRKVTADARVINYVIDGVSVLDEAEFEVIRTMKK